jgi:hypothetical protein
MAAKTTVNCPACGRKANTRFCGECGAKVLTDPVSDLIAYLQKKSRSARTSAEKMGQSAAEEGTDGDKKSFCQKRADSLLAAAEKWDAWHEAVVNLAERAKNGDG